MAGRTVLTATSTSNSRKHSSRKSSPLRPALVALHPNLRRLPSRLMSQSVQAGAKRKRANENAHAGGRPTRGSGTLKRLRSASSTYSYSTDESEDEMPVDDETTQGDESSEYLLNTATTKELGRLRKDVLVRLCATTEMSVDCESLTKNGLVDAIMAAREQDQEAQDEADNEESSGEDQDDVPPSSPPGNSSDFSSDDGGNVPEEEEEEEEEEIVQSVSSPLKRRATMYDIGKLSSRPSKTRSMSMGNIFPTQQRQIRSSPLREFPFPSPPATRLRSRKLSDSTTSKALKKGKQVEFSDHVLRHPPMDDGAESDLTELEVLEERLRTSDPSPRRLRSKKDVSSSASSSGGSSVGSSRRRVRTLSAAIVAVDSPVVEEQEPEFDSARRITPMRKAKGRIGNLREPDDAEDDAEMIQEDELIDDDQQSDQENSDEAGSDQEDSDQVNSGQEASDQQDSEVDQLEPSPAVKTARTPVRTRQRTRKLQTHTPPSQNDSESEEELDDDQETIAVQPRILRNGKIVGDEEEEEDIEEASEDEQSSEHEMEIDQASNAGSIDDEDIDAEGEIDQDMVDEDVDLTLATAKTLVRLRRDDLVRLCETRDLDIAGTKPQLAESLLQWRDHNLTDFSSPSSAGTVRPPSTVRRSRHRRGRSSGTEEPHEDLTSGATPVLERSERVHTDEPRTPPLSQNRKEHEPELELDLESLGLDDREIPPEKLTKLEKIGSGGFKDVFIGKFKGRKIAISEFRGHLTAMDIKELKLLGGFDHPNIVRFLGVSIPENTRETPVMIISELCANGDLFDYVRNVQPPTLHKVLCMMLDIARGLEYLHLRKPSVIHRDCKSSNILITKNGVAKIADFGLAKVKQSTRSMVRSLVGTVNWQAPELWHAHPMYNHKVDVFSCAMVYWEMLQWHQSNKKFPWEGMNEHAIYEIVGAKKQRPSVTGLRKHWCSDLVDLVERMWAHEHQDRPTMSEVVEELERIKKL